MLAALVVASSATAANSKVLVIRFGPDLEVNPVTKDYVNHQLSEAEKHYDAAVIVLDTPGGLSVHRFSLTVPATATFRQAEGANPHQVCDSGSRVSASKPANGPSSTTTAALNSQAGRPSLPKTLCSVCRETLCSVCREPFAQSGGIPLLSAARCLAVGLSGWQMCCAPRQRPGSRTVMGLPPSSWQLGTLAGAAKASARACYAASFIMGSAMNQSSKRRALAAPDTCPS
jgi:hypothetical protein